MSAAGNAKGGLGWVILVVALAVPGVLFYNWWSHLKADREKAVAAKARGRVPEGGVFQPSPNDKLVNPMTPAASTETATAALSASTEAAAAVAASPAAAAPAPTPEPAAEAPVAAPPAASTATAAALPLKRDPTLSPFDQVRLLEEEEARRAAAEALAAAARPKRGSKAKAAVNPITLVELMGIISNAESGFKAIVNNEVLGVGEFIGSTKIKVVKITDLGVTFDYKGKRFSKSVSQE